MSGSPMGMGMVPRLQPDVRGVRKKFQMTNFTMPNNISSMEYALKSVPGLHDVGGEDGSRTPAIGSRSKKYTPHADQHEKLKGQGRQ